ncbi:IS3 family transposase [Streptomyces sp. NBC_00500]|uniref:IS3 family transposase n=1 Tax=unclassified Streptomyces TaxID=2593676 RepID=UPI003866EE6F
MRHVHQDSDGAYGVPQITAELRDDGRAVNHQRVARVVRTIGLTGVRLRRRHRTTVPAPSVSPSSSPGPGPTPSRRPAHPQVAPAGSLIVALRRLKKFVVAIQRMSAASCCSS